MSRHGSMNRVYRVVWNVRRRVWQAAAETCGRQRRGALSAGGSGSASRPSAPRLASGALLLILIPFTARAGTLPDGGRVVAGDASIGRQGDTLNIDQTSRNAAIDWRSFSVGEGNTVRFNQPGRDAATLNRVTGGEVSSIRGAIEANGRVFLVNPNGVHFSSTARVDVGALVASTLDISTEDFMNGDYRFSGDSANAVINRGNIRTAQGGLVAMIAAEIVNTGDITTPRGSTLMGAGSTVTLDLGGPVSIEVKEARLNTLIEQGGAIRADGGLVYLTAKAAGDLAASVINHTGMTQARTLAAGENGEIRLMGDMDHGSVQVAGTLDAGAPASLNPEGGDGGFIETSAAKVKVADEARVTTRADQGKTGEWLIDPSDFTVSAGGAGETDSGIGADTLSDNLADNSITVQTVESGSGNGDIFVNDAVTWQSGTTLTLNAHRDIEINATIDASQGSGGKLALEYGQGSSDGQIGDRAAEYRVNAPVNLQAGQNFSTKLGSDGDTIDYTVITDLGAAGSTSGEDLQGMAGDLAGNYALGANIDASDTASWNGDAGFAPVGDGDNDFAGTFDGLGHTISDLTIFDSAYAGMFGAVGTGGRVSNVGLVGGSVEGSYAAGGLVGKNQGTIRAVYATGRVSGSDAVGGLVGLNESGGTVSNAYATGAVAGSLNSFHIGGLVGRNKGTVSNAYSTGAVQGGNTFTGGLVGLNEGTISNAYATGAVTGSIAVGGLVGATSRSPGVLNNVYWDSATTNQSSAGANAGSATDIATTRHNHDGYGGLGTWRETAAGTGVWVAHDADNNPQWVMFEGSTRPFLYSEYSTTIHNAHQLQLTALDLTATYVLAGDIDASATAGTNAAGMWGSSGFVPVGDGDNKFTGNFDGLGHTIPGLTIDRSRTVSVGLFGYVGSDGTVQNISLSGGSVTGYLYVGGLVGRNVGTITNAYATGSVTGTSNVVGGLVGWNDGGTISNAYATGIVTGPYTIGGLVGSNDGTITNAYATGAVKASLYGAGGLVGSNVGTITNTYATGSVTGTSSSYYVGGLVGRNDGGTISNAYATGIVTGSYYVGGLVGLNGGTITNAYATGAVKASLFGAGGLVGSTGGTIISAYYATTDSDGNPINSGAGYETLGEGKSLADLQKLETFADWGADIDDAGDTGTVWRLYDGFTTPLLRTFLKQVTVTVNDETGRTYDGTEVTVSGSGHTLSDETASLLGSADYTDVTTRNAGDYALGISGLYSGQQGYDIKVETGRYTVEKATLTLSAVTDSKTYDGDTTSAGEVKHGTLHGTDSLTGLSQSFDSKNAGDNRTLTVDSGYTLDDGNGGNNYTVTTTSANGTIERRELTINGTSAANKTYDGTTSADITLGALGNLVDGENLNVSASGTFDNANAGNRTATAHYTLANGDDGLASNYVLADTSGHEATIDRRVLTVSGTGAANKTYDGTTTANISAGILGNLVDGENLNVSASGTFDSANAGERSATVHYTLANGDDGLASNYVLADTSGHEATIDRRVLTISGTSAADKTYDGTTSADITLGALGNLVDGENLNVSASGTFDSANAGERSATAHYTLTDGDDGLASNYKLADTSGHEATISQRELSISGTTAANKTYDGDTSADITVGTLSNLVEGEKLDVTASGTFDSANAGERSATAHYTLANGEGGLASNYKLADTSGHEATIDRRVLTISGTSAANKTYDGSTTANITVGTLGNLVEGESLNVSASGTFDSANAGGRTATAYYTLADGDDGLAGNYTLADSSGLSAEITRRRIGGTVTAVDRVYDGSRQATLNGALDARAGDNGLIEGDNLKLVASGEFTDKNAGDNKTVNYSGAALTGDDAGNYTFTGETTGTLTATITPRSVTVTADDQRKIAGVVDPALTYRTGCASGQTVDCGLVAGESLAGALSREAGEEAGDYAILQGTVTEALNANYLIDFVPGELVVDFTAGRPLQGTLSALQGTTSRWAGEEVGGGRKPAAPFSGGSGVGVDAGGGETAPGGLTLVRVNDEKEAASTRPGAGSLNMVVVGSGINTDTDNSL